MLLPLTHEQTTVRRLPWVTFGIMIACVAAFLITSPASHRSWTLFAERFQTAIELFAQHPYLDLQPRARELLDLSDEELEAHREAQSGSRPESAAELAEEQARLDALVNQAFAAYDSSPSMQWGLVPGKMRVHALITHLFMHAGWMHLLGNMFFLYIAGPFLEDRWGRALYGGFYLAAGIVAGLTFALHYPGLDTPLIGASGAINGVLGAFLMRFWSMRIRFLAWIVVPVVFTARAWVMLPILLLRELGSARMGDIAAPGSGTGVAYWAHVGGMVFGIAVAWAISRMRIEERFIDRAIEAKITLVDNTAVDQAMEAHQQGRSGEALEMLRRVAAAEPGNPDAITAYWNLARDLERTSEALPYLVRGMQRAVMAGDVDLVVTLWPDVLDAGARAPGQPIVDAAVAIRVTDLLRKAGAIQLVPETVALAWRSLPAAAAPGALLRLARLAIETRIDEAAAIVDAALAHPEIPDEARAELLQARADLPDAPSAPEPPAPEPPAPALPQVSPPAPPPPAQTTPPPGEHGAASPQQQHQPAIAAPVPERKLRVMRAIPVELHEQVLTLRSGSSFPTIRLEEIAAVAAVGIAGGAARPFLLIDLLLDDPGSPAEVLRLIRMAGFDYDPRTLTGHQGKTEAFRHLLEQLLACSGAAPLPTAAAAVGRPFLMYPTIAAYETQVLGAHA